MMRDAFTALLVSCGLVACSHYPQEDGQRLANEVYALQTQVNAMQKAVAELQRLAADQNAKVTKTLGEVSSLNQAARRNDADLGVQLDEMMQEVARLKGQVESSGERLSTLESAVNKVNEETELRFQDIKEKERIEALQQEERARAISEAENREKLLAAPSTLFAEVKKLISTNKPTEARRLLRDFIRSPSGKKGKAALDDAQFLIGETFYAEGNFQAAAAEYNGVRKKHPNSPRVPEALFKLGLCFEKLNLKDDAKLFYQTVVKKYGRSSVAKDAQKRLATLK